MKPTIEDVARLADVSPSTVSRALQDSPRISQATKERVRQAVRLLNYRPNAVASGLRSKRTRAVGVVIPDSANPIFSQILRGIAGVLHRRGYHILLCITENAPEQEERHVDVLLQRQVDGLIVSVTRESGPHLDVLRRAEVPVVYVNRNPVDLEGVRVVADHEDAVRQAVTHLVTLGHRRIGILHGDLSYSTGRGRLKGYEEALADHGIPLDPAIIRSADFSAERAYEGTLALLDGERPPTALLATDIHSSMGIVRALQHRGVAVPGRMSVVGYDDHGWAELLTPPLTVVAQPAFEMGAEAARALLAALNESGPRQSREIRLPCRLVVRRSTAPPPAA